MYGFKTLEKKYNVQIIEDGNRYFACDKKEVKLYKIYTCNGNLVFGGLTKYAVKKVCEAMWEVKT